MAFSFAQKLVSTGTPAPLARELASQMETGVFNARRLMALSMVPPLARYIATSLASGTFSAFRAADLGLSTASSDIVAAGANLNALSPSKALLSANQTDVNWVVNGDSTGNATDEWIYLLFAAIGTQYPAYTVSYYPPDSNGGYLAPVTVRSGSGPNTFRLYNNSNSGRNAQFLMGDKFTGAFVTPGRAWDLIITNHGKNHVAGVPVAQAQGELMAAIAQLQLAFPDANFLVTNQYPNRDDANMATADTAWRDIVANAPKIALIDQYNSVQYVASDYQDNVHLTAAANAAKLFPLALSLWQRTLAGAFAPETPWLSIQATNLLNGDSSERFTDYTQNGNGTVAGAANVLPAGHTSTGTITYAQDASIVYGGAALSQRLQAGGSGLAFMRRTLTTANLAVAKGNNVVLTTLKYVSVGSAATVGRTGLGRTGGTSPTTVNSRSLAEAQGAFRVECIGPLFVPEDTVAVQFTAYADSAATVDSTHPVNFHRAFLTIGNLPRVSA